jgi:hypothetical protein
MRIAIDRRRWDILTPSSSRFEVIERRYQSARREPSAPRHCEKNQPDIESRAATAAMAN